MSNRVGERGQVTIPKALRQRFGIRPGSRVEFVEEDGRIVVRKVPSQNPVDDVYGIITLEGGTDAFLTELRDPE